MTKFNTVIVGNIAFDVNEFHFNDSNAIIKHINTGGACIYSAIPASLFYNVGIVSRIGSDFDKSIFKDYEIDLEGLKLINDAKTTKFYHTFKTNDRQERVITGEVNKKLLINKDDIPKAYYSAKHFHIATNYPKLQLSLIEKIRENSDAIISVDTIEHYHQDPYIIDVFNSVDIAFIDIEFENLLNCNAPTKIIKLGKKGCMYKSLSESFEVFSEISDNVVDKLGAGDCQNGVFINLISNGVDTKRALQIAVQTATLSIENYGIEHIKSNKKLSKIKNF